VTQTAGAGWGMQGYVTPETIRSVRIRVSNGNSSSASDFLCAGSLRLRPQTQGESNSRLALNNKREQIFDEHRTGLRGGEGVFFVVVPCVRSLLSMQCPPESEREREGRR